MARSMTRSDVTIERGLCLLVPVLTSGCGRAPSVDLFGSFFPAWMVCLLIAVAGAAGCRVFLLRRDLEKDVGPLVLFYPCLILLITCLTWLVLY